MLEEGMDQEVVVEQTPTQEVVLEPALPESEEPENPENAPKSEHFPEK
jgi:hypothetical protein